MKTIIAVIIYLLMAGYVVYTLYDNLSFVNAVEEAQESKPIEVILYEYN